MITDTEIKVKGIEMLVEALGEMNAERFITLLLREPFDYTKWQRNLWTDKNVKKSVKWLCITASQEVQNRQVSK